jgi:paraquat-inducible protein B
MASPRANPTVIGAFVVGAAVLGVAAVILFGSGRLFEPHTTWVAYFDRPVTGLDEGAPVIFQGVTVGEVTRIDAVVDSTSYTAIVPVYFDLVAGRVEVVGPGMSGTAGIQKFIEHGGLRAQLKSQSLITGKLYLDLGVHPDMKATYQHLDPSVPEIPTIPTELEQAGEKVRDVIDRISQLPLEDMVRSLASAADGLDHLVNKPELAHAIEQLDVTLQETKALVGTLDGRVQGIADRTDAALEQVRSTAAEVDSLVAPGSPLQYQLLTTLQEIESASRSLRLLADGLARQPQQLLFGKEAPKR